MDHCLGTNFGCILKIEFITNSNLESEIIFCMQKTIEYTSIVNDI